MWSNGTGLRRKKNTFIVHLSRDFRTQLFPLSMDLQLSLFHNGLMVCFNLAYFIMICFNLAYFIMVCFIFCMFRVFPLTATFLGTIFTSGFKFSFRFERSQISQDYSWMQEVGSLVKLYLTNRILLWRYAENVRTLRGWQWQTRREECVTPTVFFLLFQNLISKLGPVLPWQYGQVRL